VVAAPAVVTHTAPVSAVYASAAPALATFIGSAPVYATPVESRAVLQPVLKKYHKDHVSVKDSSSRYVLCLHTEKRMHSSVV
jgi:hypothetical protein